MPAKPVFSRAPLSPNPYAALPPGAIVPKGRLLERLRAQAGGLAGHIEEVWPSMRGNAWLGGDGDDWERGPYVFDGLIPLAHILKDEGLLALCGRFVEWTLSSQDEEGWFGPATNEGYWPRMVALKALKQHFEATGDRRVLPFMHRYFRCQFKRLDAQPLELWAKARAGENILCALWLYNISGDKGLLRLCAKLFQGSIDWTAHFSAFPHMRDLKRELPWRALKARLDAEPGQDGPAWTMHQLTHAVNLAMALKTPALHFAYGGGLKQKDAFKLGYSRLMKAHGLAHGLFSGDEHLSGASPSQGTETCAVAEALFSLETLMGLSCEGELGDLYERIGYNALPAALSADGWTHQYDQQVNQIRIAGDLTLWYNNGPGSNLFGLEPNFGCCTANLHQGLPKFAAHLWMATRENGLICQSYAPCTVRASAGGVRLRIEVEGDYPQAGEIAITLHPSAPCAFPLLLRIPAWADGAFARVGGERFEGKAGGILRVERLWSVGDRVELSLPMAVYSEEWQHHSLAIYKGPLLYALPLEPLWEVDGELPLGSRSAEPGRAWNYGLFAGGERRVLEDGSIEVRGARLPSWKEKGGVAAPPPVLPRQEAPEEALRLIPYADAPLRIAQFPQIRRNAAQSD
ncbi:MAG: glycoside hydrolase family 127 protein [Christensenellaceae bacterium]|nr:glycoside hydrolase family 127 protein [Christensenellaceae bacterium]